MREANERTTGWITTINENQPTRLQIAPQRARSKDAACLRYISVSPNQVLTHAARAAVFSHSVAARGAREGPWSGQRKRLSVVAVIPNPRASRS